MLDDWLGWKVRVRNANVGASDCGVGDDVVSLPTQFATLGEWVLASFVCYFLCFWGI